MFASTSIALYHVIVKVSASHIEAVDITSADKLIFVCISKWPQYHGDIASERDGDNVSTPCLHLSKPKVALLRGQNPPPYYHIAHALDSRKDFLL
jgi:hypothetical protein